MGAKVTVDGVEKLNDKFITLLGTLRKVRTEMSAINGNGSTGGVDANASTSKLGGMIRGFGGGASGGGRSPFLSGGVSLALSGMSTINARTQRNMMQSAGISATDSLFSSMYGFNYSGAETARFNASGKFGGSREEQLRASTLGFRYGQTFEKNTNFMGSLGNVVQASGGTLSLGQAAESAGDFIDPIVLRRAKAMGIPMGKQGGQVQNPLSTAQGYLRNYESRFGKLDSNAFADLSSAGSTARFSMSRLYGLGDSAIDQIQQAGMQNLQFRKKTGGGRDINFNNAGDLSAIGNDEDRLGLRSTQLSTVVGRRESNFFARQEGNMTSRIGQEITIQETLGKVEDKFGSLIGALFQMENVIKGVTAALGGMAMLGMGRGAAGVAGAMGGQAQAVATAATNTAAAAGTSSAAMATAAKGKPFGMSSGNTYGTQTGTLGKPSGSFKFDGMKAAMGGSMLIGGVVGAATSTSGLQTGMSIVSATAGGAMVGSMFGPGPGTAIGAGIGFSIGAGSAIWNNLEQGKDEGIRKGSYQGSTMTDAALIESLGDYTKNDKIGVGSTGGLLGGAGRKQRGRFDVWAGRRSMLISAALGEAVEGDTFSDLASEEAAELASLITKMSGPDAMTKDAIWEETREVGDKYMSKLKSTPGGKDIYKKYFGRISSPWSYEPIKTEQYDSLVMSSQQLLESATMTGGGSGDPVSGGGGSRGDGNPWTPQGGAADGRGPGHPSWDKLDGRMKGRLGDLLKASGGKVWVGEGWRDPVASEPEFLRRHFEDPKGNRKYKGKRYSLRKGEAPMAPPGQSNHNIGLAADLVGDMAWLQQNAAKFGLKTFANVPGIKEDWHVQLAELANGFLGDGETQGTGNLDSNIASTGDTPGGGSGGSTGGSNGGGGGGGASSGVGYSIKAAIESMGGGGGGGGFQGTGASTTAGSEANVAEYTGGKLSAEQVAQMAHAAGFRGQDLINVVAIAKRESGYDPGALNPDRSTGDDSYGLMQINMLGDMGPARRAMFGITNNAQLYDPMTNLKAAFTMYQGHGNSLRDWGAYKGRENTYDTNIEAAAQAVASAGVGGGDPVPSGMAAPFRGGGEGSSGGVVINLGGVTINSSGNVGYDADAFLRAISPKLQEAAGMMMKRTSG
jgi:hypothetical protein